MAKQDSRDQILRKTFYLLLIKGYDGVSISDIQSETGMSRGLLYHYFGGKEELFRTAAEIYMAKLFLTDPTRGERLGMRGMIEDEVRRFSELYRSWDDFPGGGKITIANYDFLIYRMIEREPSIANIYTEMRVREIESWTTTTMRAQQSGEIQTRLSAQKIARHVIALLDGLWLQAAEQNDPQLHLRCTREVLTDYYDLIKV